MNNQKGSANAFLVIAIVILAAAVVYFAFIKKPVSTVDQPQTTTVENTQPTTVQSVNTPVSQTSGQKVETTIYVPKDQAAYDQRVLNDQDGTAPGMASLTSADFKTQKVTVTTTPSYGLEQATADAAAAIVQSQADIKTVGFKVVGSTAYVVLNINVDGWAGVSNSIDAVTPIIRQTLLQFSDIKNVDIGSQEAFKVTGVPTP